MAVGSDQPRQFRDIFKSVIPFTATVDFGAAGANDDATGFASADITVAGAALGDLVLVSPSIDLADLVIDANVSAAGVVTATVNNGTTASVNLASMTVKGVVMKFDDEVGVAGE